MSSDGDDQRIFLGFKFSILGFLGGGKIWQVFFLGWLDLCRDYLENCSCYFGNFRGSEILHGTFCGLIFGLGIFGGFVGTPRDFFGFFIFSPIQSSPLLEFWSMPLPPPPPPRVKSLE